MIKLIVMLSIPVAVTAMFWGFSPVLGIFVGGLMLVHFVS